MFDLGWNEAAVKLLFNERMQIIAVFYGFHETEKLILITFLIFFFWFLLFLNIEFHEKQINFYESLLRHDGYPCSNYHWTFFIDLI